MTSKLQNASMYQTRNEHRGKQSHDNTKPSRQLISKTNSELQMPVGIVVMYMDHNGFYCIKENLSWLTPGTSHPGRLPLSPSFKFEVDDISVHFRKQISKMKCVPAELGAIPNWKPIRIARHSEWELFRMAMCF